MHRKSIELIIAFTLLCFCLTQHSLYADEVPDGMVLIPAGEFEMGTNNGEHPNERPAHTVHLDAFYMDTYEVTNAQYKAFLDANPQWQKDKIPREFHDGVYLRFWEENTYPEGEADYPVVYVSWYAAMAYAQWAGKRLPTEAQWEKAARGGLIGKAYPWGDTIDAARANYARHINEQIPIGEYAPNGYGLYDMAGNVSEWCLDKYDADFYGVAPHKNPFSGGTPEATIKNFKKVTEKKRVLRGGCWSDHASFLRVAYRHYGAQNYTSVFCGFRCVKPVKQ